MEDVLSKALGPVGRCGLPAMVQVFAGPALYLQLLLVALNFLKPATVREGVKWLPEKQLDVFFVTLNNADKDYSPTTMHHDYSINENLPY